MTRERFEQILFANVSDEVVQDMLNQYVLELESSNATLRMRVASLESALEGMHLIREMDLAENTKLRELIADVHESLKADKAGMFHNLTLSAMEDDMRELGIEVDYGQQRDV